nr:MAG TPA: hypothetical protein [Caudoviricetes sp.]
MPTCSISHSLGWLSSTSAWLISLPNAQSCFLAKTITSFLLTFTRMCNILMLSAN